MYSNPNVTRFFDEVKAAETAEAKWGLLNTALRHHGFIAAGYALSNGLKSGSIADEMVYRGSYRQDFVQTYLSEGLADDDYAMVYGSQNDAPAFWRDIKGRNMTPGRQRFIAICDDFGVTDGLVVPFRGVGEAPRSGLALQSDPQVADSHRDHIRAHLDEIVQLCAVFDTAMREPQSIRELYRLSPREIECLKHLCHGRINKEIADRTGLTDRTVEHYLSNAMRKLKSRNRHHAAAKAVMLGITRV